MPETSSTRRGFLSVAFYICTVTAVAVFTFCVTRIQILNSAIRREAEDRSVRHHEEMLRHLEEVKDDIQDLQLRVNRLVLERDMPPPREIMQFVPIAPDPAFDARLLEDGRSIREICAGLGVPYHLYQNAFTHPSFGASYVASKVLVRACGCSPTIHPAKNRLEFNHTTGSWELQPIAQ